MEYRRMSLAEWLFFVGGRSLLTSFALADEVCNDALFDKALAPALVTAQALAGDGLFTSETSNPKWRKAHAILMPCFSLKAMRIYLPMMVDIAEQLVERWQRLNAEDEINVVDDMTRLTLDTVGICGFGYRFNSFSRQDMHPFVQSLNRVLTALPETATRSSLETTLRFRQRWQSQEDLDLMFSTVDRLIKERKASGEEGAEKTDLLNAMLNGTDPQTGEGLDDRNIRDQIMTFLIAGHETTSSLLSFALYFLINHPIVLARAYEEVDNVLGRDTKIPPTYEQVHQLQYISQILKESLRLCPPASFLAGGPTRIISLVANTRPPRTISYRFMSLCCTETEASGEIMLRSSILIVISVLKRNRLDQVTPLNPLAPVNAPVLDASLRCKRLRSHWV
jgi:cytochrome P450 / NADPH-cytochrome P450 reductase